MKVKDLNIKKEYNWIVVFEKAARKHLFLSTMGFKQCVLDYTGLKDINMIFVGETKNYDYEILEDWRELLKDDKVDFEIIELEEFDANFNPGSNHIKENRIAINQIFKYLKKQKE